MHKKITAALFSRLVSGPLLAKEPIELIQPAQNINQAQAELGMKLYFDRVWQNRALFRAITVTT